MMKKIGVIGAGFVGNAVIQNLNDEVEVMVYDIDNNKSNAQIYDVLEECYFIFLCLPTNMSEDGTQDFSAYQSFFDSLSVFDGLTNIFIIKSTVLYENIKPYLDKYNIVMNPEFLNANSSVEDFREQKQIILGGNPLQMKEIKELYLTYFKFSDLFVEFVYMSYEEAINLKYMHNIYHAYKVLFWNFVQERTGNARLYAKHYKKIRQGLDSEMSQISPDGKMGYGGACVLGNRRVVLDDDSQLQFKDLYELEYNGKVKSTSYDLMSNEIKNVEKVTKRQYDGLLYTFVFNNNEFTCTEDHLIPIKRNGAILLIEAKYVMETDELFLYS